MTTLNIDKTVTNFVTALGNGKKAAELLLEIVDWTVEGVETDSTKLSGIMDKAVRKGDINANRAIRAIVGAIWTDGKASKSKDKKTTVLKLGKTVDTDALDRLRKGVTAGLSLRDTLVKEVKGKSEEVEYDLKKAALNDVKAYKKNKVSLAAALAAITAAYAA
jgi:hypothetical protein